MRSKKFWISAAIIVLLCAAAVLGAISLGSQTGAQEINISDAEALVNEAFDSMANTDALKVIASKNHITANEISYGGERDITLKCTVNTVDLYPVMESELPSLLGADEKKANGTMYKSALDFKMEFDSKVASFAEKAEPVQIETEIKIYDVKGELVVYKEKSVTDSIFGRAVKLADEISAIKEFTDTDGEKKTIKSGNVNKGLINTIALSFDELAPDTSTTIGRMWNSLKRNFNKNFIEHDRWETILGGLLTTIELTICALIIGIIIGFLVAFVRCTYVKNPRCGLITKILNSISGVYLTIIRGTPVVVQIMIIYFVIFMPLGVDKFTAAVICFGLNSGAYVAEIVRGGIMSIDDGQSEAGRSLGFGYMATMWHIVFPQAFKAVLPALANEFVVLLKETSIAFYIGLGDLMYAGNAIRAATYSAFMPLIAVALIYLVMVLVLSKLVNILERKLRDSER